MERGGSFFCRKLLLVCIVIHILHCSNRIGRGWKREGEKEREQLLIYDWYRCSICSQKIYLHQFIGIYVDQLYIIYSFFFVYRFIFCVFCLCVFVFSFLFMYFFGNLIFYSEDLLSEWWAQQYNFVGASWFTRHSQWNRLVRSFVDEDCTQLWL